jgi:hypothetical protein
VGPEGVLRVGLRVDGARVVQVRISSSRPDIARQLLSGRSRAEAVAMVPRLFSICARSQAAASELACAAAAGEPVAEAILARARDSVSAETLRETAWRTLLEWPKTIGELPGEAAIAAARGALTGPVGGSGEAIALAAFGSSAEEWLALQTLPALQRWADQGRTATARFVRHALDDDDAAAGTQPAQAMATVALLATPEQASTLVELAQAIEADPAFARRPIWRGAAAETGALARWQSDALLRSLMQRCHSRVPARFVARLHELALLLAGRGSAALGATALPDGSGLAWIENARGLLVHRLRLVQGRTADYRIVAPTEWNFHPDGALPAAILDTPAHDLDALHRHVSVLVDSLDPCVACSVEVEDA